MLYEQALLNMLGKLKRTLTKNVSDEKRLDGEAGIQNQT